MWEKDPTRIIFSAVRGMLPKNKLRVYRLDKLKIFPEAEHPFKGFDLVPFVPKPKSLDVSGLGWPLPDGFQPFNPEKFAFRMQTSPALRSRGRPELDFTDLMTAEEKQLLKQAGKQ